MNADVSTWRRSLLRPARSILCGWWQQWRIARARAWLVRRGCVVDAGVSLRGRPRVENGGRIVLGEGVEIWSDKVCVHLSTGVHGNIEIGRGSLLNQGVTLHAEQHIHLGRDALIGEHVAIHDTNFHPVSPDAGVRTSRVWLGDNVWVGHRAVILAGVTIGDHAVVGAGSVVTRDVPARSVVAGVPAQVVRTFSCPDHWKRPGLVADGGRAP